MTTLSGFKDSKDRFKVFREDEAPTKDAPFITIELSPGGRDQRTGWANVQAIFAVHGADTQWATLYQIADKVREVFEGANCTAAVAGTKLHYQTVGRALFSEGRNPVTEHVNVSVGLTFGIVA